MSLNSGLSVTALMSGAKRDEELKKEKADRSKRHSGIFGGKKDTGSPSDESALNSPLPGETGPNPKSRMSFSPNPNKKRLSLVPKGLSPGVKESRLMQSMKRTSTLHTTAGNSIFGSDDKAEKQNSSLKFSSGSGRHPNSLRTSGRKMTTFTIDMDKDKSDGEDSGSGGSRRGRGGNVGDGKNSGGASDSNPSTPKGNTSISISTSGDVGVVSSGGSYCMAVSLFPLIISYAAMAVHVTFADMDSVYNIVLYVLCTFVWLGAFLYIFPRGEAQPQRRDLGSLRSDGADDDDTESTRVSNLRHNMQRMTNPGSAAPVPVGGRGGDGEDEIDSEKGEFPVSGDFGSSSSNGTTDLFDVYNDGANRNDYSSPNGAPLDLIVLALMSTSSLGLIMSSMRGHVGGTILCGGSIMLVFYLMIRLRKATSDLTDRGVKIFKVVVLFLFTANVFVTLLAIHSKNARYPLVKATATSFPDRCVNQAPAVWEKIYNCARISPLNSYCSDVEIEYIGNNAGNNNTYCSEFDGIVIKPGSNSELGSHVDIYYIILYWFKDRRNSITSKVAVTETEIILNEHLAQGAVTELSFWWGFVDDIVFRVEKVGEENSSEMEDTRIEVQIHSQSRMGLSDSGVNTARLRELFSHLCEELKNMESENGGEVIGCN